MIKNDLVFLQPDRKFKDIKTFLDSKRGCFEIFLINITKVQEKAPILYVAGNRTKQT